VTDDASIPRLEVNPRDTSVINADSESDISACLSENDSILSVPESSISQTSVDSHSDSVDSLLVAEFVHLLYGDKTLQSLAMEAVGDASIGMDRMRNNFRRLLLHCAKDIRAEVENTEHRGLPGFIRRHAGHISSGLFSMIELTLTLRYRTEAGLTTEHLQNVETRATKASRQKVECFLREIRGDTEADDSDDNGDILEAEADEDEEYDGSLTELLQIRDLILGSTAFQMLRWKLYHFVHPSLPSELLGVLSSWQQLGSKRRHYDKSYGLSSIVAELHDIPVSQISIEDGNDRAGRLAVLVGAAKARIEELTGARWDWWLFQSYKRPLHEKEARVAWRCVSFEQSSAAPNVPLCRA